jgi:hypothetical protein
MEVTLKVEWPLKKKKIILVFFKDYNLYLYLTSGVGNVMVDKTIKTIKTHFSLLETIVIMLVQNSYKT